MNYVCTYRWSEKRVVYCIKVYKKSIFLTTYPPPLVNVVCERPSLYYIRVF